MTTETEAKAFKREERYIVFKKSHLSAKQLEKLERLITPPQIPPANSHDDPTLPTVKCVVVEHDWPEYETVWQMIEARCTGRRPTVPEGLGEELFAIVKCTRHENDAPEIGDD